METIFALVSVRKRDLYIFQCTFLEGKKIVDQKEKKSLFLLGNKRNKNVFSDKCGAVISSVYVEYFALQCHLWRL